MKQDRPAPRISMIPSSIMGVIVYLCMFMVLAIVIQTRESLDPILWIYEPNTSLSFDLVAEHIYGLESQNDSGLPVVAAALPVRARALRLGRFEQGLNKSLKVHRSSDHLKALNNSLKVTRSTDLLAMPSSGNDSDVSSDNLAPLSLHSGSPRYLREETVPSRLHLSDDGHQ